MSESNTEAKPAVALDRKPAWLKVRAPRGERYTGVKATLRNLDLNTVCEEAHCPNVGECWGQGTATVMLLGHVCTRGCRFCAVTTGHPRGAVDPREPENTARAVVELGLRYVVLTMVDRDDLLDGGAAHVAETVSALKRRDPSLLVETLTGDFAGKSEPLEVLLTSAPHVFAHNVEVVRRITPRVRDKRCSYDLSVNVLRQAKKFAPNRFVKSSIMVGIGETDSEVMETLEDLRAAGVDIVTLGQYLRPSAKHVEVERWVTPEQFERYAEQGRALGFAHVASGPLVRSSYHASEGFVASQLASQSSENDAAAPGPPRISDSSGPTDTGIVPVGSLVRRVSSSR